MENSVEDLPKVKMKALYDPAMLLLGIYPKEMKSASQRDMYIHIFISALFKIAVRKLI